MGFGCYNGPPCATTELAGGCPGKKWAMKEDFIGCESISILAMAMLKADLKALLCVFELEF